MLRRRLPPGSSFPVCSATVRRKTGTASDKSGNRSDSPVSGTSRDWRERRTWSTSIAGPVHRPSADPNSQIGCSFRFADKIRFRQGWERAFVRFQRSNEAFDLLIECKWQPCTTIDNAPSLDEGESNRILLPLSHRLICENFRDVGPRR